MAAANNRDYKTITEIRELREETLKKIGARLGRGNYDGAEIHLMVCGSTGCTSSGSGKLLEKLDELMERDGLSEKVAIVKTGCFGLCAEGPIIMVQPGNYMYTQVTLEDLDAIWECHIKGGSPVETLISQNESEFFSKQKRVALRNCGRINPECIDEYIAFDGYEALSMVLTEMEPEDVIDTIKKSGLRGRGGGGFPAGTKWEAAAKQECREKYICCNADEGDPGAFMDRSILEGDPHSVIEAMAIAGYAVGAHKGFIYIRAEYPIAVERLRTAIGQAREYGLLGKNILGRGFEFDIEIRLGAGAFVCGEGSALMISIEGNRGEPRPKPPRATEKGLFGKPTVLNNVETFANVPQIIVKGLDWYNSIGTEKSKGTKVFAVSGKINNTGLVEIPMGTSLREIIYDIGGGIPEGKKFKAA